MSLTGEHTRVMGASGPSALATRTRDSELRLGRLTEYKNKKGEIPSVLAWDDLTHMKLEAGNVVEARDT